MNATQTDAASIEELDKRNFLHPFTSIAEQLEHGPHVMTRGEGCRIWDRQGREYLDAMAGLWCVNVGYGRQEVVDAISRQAAQLPYFHTFMAMGNEPAIKLAHRLAELTPDPLSRVFFGCTGSDANDTQVKLVWNYNNLLGRPEKRKIISRQGSYHGVTAVAASMTGLPHLHKAFNLPLDGFLHTAKPHHYWEAEPGMSEREFSAHLAHHLEELIAAEGAQTIAAFIAEPIMGAGGVIPPPEGYFEAIVPILREHDILLISDEVICGFGRLGKPFGCEYYGFQPDLMTVAKGLTSGYVPMSASILSEPIWEVLRDGTSEVGHFAHGYTYSAHPLAAAAALAVLDVYEDEALFERAAKIGTYFQHRISERLATHPLVGEHRGVGMVAALELVADREKKQPFELSLGVARRLYSKALAEGLICRPIGNAVALSPPLIIGEAEVDEIVDKLARGLDGLSDELVAAKLWHPA